jgi:hypothetical protein
MHPVTSAFEAVHPSLVARAPALPNEMVLQVESTPSRDQYSWAGPLGSHDVAAVSLDRTRRSFLDPKFSGPWYASKAVRS